MSDDESDSEIYLEPSREPIIQADALANLEILNQKTINFEDLMNEFVRRGCLSFEEKFKIMSGVVDDENVNTTIQLKCGELYQTLLVKKRTPWSKIIKCWEETGNSYLVGRFDTHFNVEGRDSKSLKFNKFKALPSHRTDFLTHMHLRNLQLSPKSLLKCLKKSSRLTSIKLERVKVPHGGRYGDDASVDFELPLILPNLKDFYFEEVTKQDPFVCIRDQSMWLDELNIKPMLFFGLNAPMAWWDAGIEVTFKIRGANILRMCPETEFKSMLRRRAQDYGGFMNPKNCPKISLFECYMPKLSLHESVTELVIYRCNPSFNELISKCENLQRISFYGEFELNNTAQLNLSLLKLSKNSLKEVALGMMQLKSSTSEEEDPPELSLDILAIDCCKCDPELFQEGNLCKIFKEIKKVVVASCETELLNQIVMDKVAEEISVSGFSGWDFNSNDSKFEELFELLHKGLKGNEANFVMKKGAEWKIEKVKKNETSEEELFKAFHWDEFVPLEGRKGWFNLPKRNEKDSNADEERDPRRVFRKNHEF